MIPIMQNQIIDNIGQLFPRFVIIRTLRFVADIARGQYNRAIMSTSLAISANGFA
jgi:hypothetical protein